MTNDELELQKDRIKRAEDIIYKIEQAKISCRAAEEGMDEIDEFDLNFQDEKGHRIVAFCETDGELAKEFARLAIKFFKEKNLARLKEYSRI